MGFLAAFGIITWVRDVRNVGGNGPKWLSLALGSAAWLGVGVGAYLLHRWADRYLSHLGISFWGGLFVVVALFLIGTGAWLYLHVPSERGIARWEQMPWDLGVMCGILPVGVAALLLSFPLLFVGATWAWLVFWLGMTVGLSSTVSCLPTRMD